MPVFLLTRRVLCCWWLALLLVGLALPTTGQNTRYTIRGRVVDTSAAALPGATVRLLNTVLGASSNIEGNYELVASLAPGTYQLEISSVGYRPERRSVTLGAEATVTVPEAALNEEATRN